ncbi:GNAT family N-acetyltransferase [Tengunoibacter tsumagoiensis]|uniref:GNAT family N-acetyltransferase n=1 Tax=Tengunoibacter tsumagoiensis TaxID=2014871 RepID=A0A401ZXI7_9CHLR|nr:GNAT family N-acetyltransferase [Tengunoibacter tsumagoiensis]GCE11559.1 GNAT family N-acetyltransferase [Tengunoibacter tsumagoiensis]
MRSSDRHGLYPAQGLTTRELSEIEQLAQVCNAYEHLDLKLNWETLKSRPTKLTNDFLYYDQGALVGFLAIFSFNAKEAELSGMVHPDHRRKGIFTQLYQAAFVECERRQLKVLLLIVEHISKSGQGFAEKLQPRSDHSEYKMVMGEPRIPESFSPQLHFRAINRSDLPILSRITALAFNMLESEVKWYTEAILEDKQRQYFVVELDNIVVGKLDVSISNQTIFIYGFGVLPEYRGRGYGRQLLAWVIQHYLTEGYRSFALEVAVENEHALGLYTSCGFAVTSRFDYYAIDLPSA